ncbi:Hsp20/alpha crystallin family protein [Pleionea sediminis]|uniref:Hsp20/alpha crystallin family protein n=1 Tax=Pleionea sediminis TaxID=2569479 RepID=UPI001185370B|nr:Hsp20/alpha crystallin family protein [Pleionea sediminis]
MSYFSQMGDGLRRAAQSVQHGWQHLWHSAANAVTHFKQSPESQAQNQSVQWGVLSCELIDEPEALTLKMEVPGVQEKDLNIDLHGQLLTIRGERQYKHEEKERNYILQERAFGSFSRQFMLPEKVDADAAKATYRDGVLNLYIPKIKSTDTVRKIPVS